MYGVAPADSFVHVTCGHCCVVFGMPRKMYDIRSNDGENWFCPNGHKQCFVDAARAATGVEEARELRQKIIDGVESWLQSFDEGNPLHAGMTVEDIRKLVAEFREREKRANALIAKRDQIKVA